MKLNCKPNDLVIIVKTNGDKDLNKYLGFILKLHGPVEDWYGDAVWAYEEPYLKRPCGTAMSRINDKCLKPLGAPLDGEDLYLDVPTESEFLVDNPEFRDAPYARPISDILSDFSKIS